MAGGLEANDYLDNNLKTMDFRGGSVQKLTYELEEVSGRGAEEIKLFQRQSISSYGSMLK